MKIILIAGARPNFMKIAPIVAELRSAQTSGKNLEWLLVHTGQHYDEAMSKVFFDDLEIPRPDIDLEVGSGSHAVQTARIMTAFEPVCLAEQPDMIVVVGDVNSTIACSLVGAKLGIKIAHVEAGLRSFDRQMPEEINRVLTDAISDYLLTSCEDAETNLVREGIAPEKIFFAGNVMIDTLLSFKKKSAQSKILSTLRLNEGSDQYKRYALMTLHRPSNVDNRQNLQRILKGLKKIAQTIPIIFPVHPRTRKQLATFNMIGEFNFYDETGRIDGVTCIPPLAYLDFIQLMAHATMVLSDSGGIQEETTILGVPCLTIRENTERPVTITEGTNELVGTDTAVIERCATDILHGRWKKSTAPKLWDGKAAKRIVDFLLQQAAG